MTKRILWIFFVISFIIAGPASGLAWMEAGNRAATPGLNLLQSDEDGLIVELVTPAYELVSQETAAGLFDQISLPGADATAEAGKPQLPQFGALIGIPPNAEIEVRVVAQESQPVAARHPILPAAFLLPSAEEMSPGELVYRPDPTAYTADGFYPASPAEITSQGWLRDQRIARLELRPFQYNPAQGSLLWHSKIRVEVRFIYPAPLDKSQAAASQPAQEDAFSPALQAALLNYEAAKNWRGLPASMADTLPAQFAQAESLGPRYRIVVDQDGLYAVTYADLAAVMADIDTVDPRNFQFSSQGAQVDVSIEGEADGSFDPGDRILFYGQKFYGQRHAERYASENAHWVTFNQQQPDGSYLPWKPQYNAIMVEKYTRENVYWLVVGSTPGSRMQTVDGDPSGNLNDPEPYFRAKIHAEEDHKWKTDQLFQTEDSWFWERIYQPTSIRIFTTTLTSPATEPYSATLRAFVMTRENLPHHTYLYFNENLVDERTLTGLTSFTMETQVPHWYLAEGTNAMRFDAEYIDIYHQYYFNWFEVEYNRLFEAQSDQLWFNQEIPGTHKYQITNFSDTAEIFALDITTPLTPTRLLNPVVLTSTVTLQAASLDPADYFIASGAAALTPAEISFYQPPDLFAASNAAEYVLITHADLITATQTLASHLAGKGLTTRVIDAQDLYNEFNDGIYNPMAFKNFLAYALANWQVAPSYALLVGDGHWNFFGHTPSIYGELGTIYMPPNLAWVDPAQGEVDATNQLATIVGSDPLPDLHIARLPAGSPAELNAYTAKLIAYESAPTNQSWQRRMLFLADNYDPKAGDFDATAERIIQKYLVPSIYQPDRIYQDAYGCVNVNSAECAAVRTAILDTLNITGTLIVSYHGHAGTQWWSHENIFTSNSLTSLNNGSRLPVVLSMDCLDGMWFFPPSTISTYAISLIEEMITAASKGAIAAFSPGGLGLATGHEILHGGFMESLMDHNIWELGPAALNAKLKLYQAGYYLDLIQTYTIIGDPSLVIPGGNINIHLPVIQK